MQPLPAAPFEACDQARGRVSSQALVRYDTNDYSVPVAYGHQDVWVRGYVDRVVIGCRGEVIARHPRCYDREDMVFDPVHYLPLIERKINALDQAAPLAEWDLPEEFNTLRRLMEARMPKMGRREYVQILRLLESFDMDDLLAAVRQALKLGAVGFGAHSQKLYTLYMGPLDARRRSVVTPDASKMQVLQRLRLTALVCAQ